MATTTTTRNGLVVIGDAALVQPSVLRTASDANAQKLDAAVLYDEGPIASRDESSPGVPGIAGRLYRVTDATPPRFELDTGTGWVTIPTDGWTVGDHKTSIQSADHGDLSGGLYLWLIHDGRELVATYTALIAALNAAGNPFGLGPNSRPKLPDGRGRVSVMPDGTAGRLTGGALGEAGGEEKHALTGPENGPHTHGGAIRGLQAVAVGSGINVSDGTNDDQTDSSGSGTPHNTMQPYVIDGNRFIRAW